MNYLDKRRLKLPPATIKALQEDTRQKLALAVSIAKRKTQAEVLEALAAVISQGEDA
ncbi:MULTISPECIES: hypothetical protein [unclassified Mesorhizobium]|uniref:hypothetical protein n=1 Tax=unclassified Mesorhizobium TaxID=325217 RepID=UPI0003D02F6C|nr:MULTISPECIES: hypothetical protein [unclassified Mesorhizobium]ESZ07167.1 hypothetical protein X736_10965 [Mesorhizobium sp. L2C089B000]WJI52560.1 hypothetical protein NLY44_07790 [Mesorhizobium sp. C089B]